MTRSHVCLGSELCDDCAMEAASQPDPELEAELDRMEAADPKLKASGGRLRDIENSPAS